MKSKGGHPIACPFLKDYVEKAILLPSKMKKSSGAPLGGCEADHWLKVCLDLAERATNQRNLEGGQFRRDRYEVTRQRALDVIWGTYAELQHHADNLRNKYEVTESRFEIGQRRREGISVVSRDVEDEQ